MVEPSQSGLRRRFGRFPLRLRRAVTITVAALLLLCVQAVASDNGSISDEQTTTYWAYATDTAPVRVAPDAHARRIDSLHLWTEDRFPEVYLVRAQYVAEDQTWFQVRVPGRPNGRSGWVTEQDLGDLHVVHTHLVVDKHKLTITLFRNNRAIFTAPVGIGKQSTPTRSGNFWIREKFPAHGGLYGPYAFGTADYSVLTDWPGGGIIGIHGTDQPALIPGRPSHGCIRMRNGDVTRLYRLVPIGTPLTIR